MRIGTASFAIVGVMPASFLFPERDVDLWFPVAVDGHDAQSRRATWYTGVGRLKRGVTIEQARGDLTRVQAQLAKEYPDTDGRLAVDVVPLKEATVGGVRQSLWVLFGAVSVLLLITCVNIASLLLSRATHRQQEISLRLSLGATRSAVAAQLLAESGLLAFAGAAAGLLVAGAASAGFRFLASDVPRIDEITLDRNVFLYTLITAVAVGLLCGLLPAIRAAREAMVATPNRTGRTQVSTRSTLQWLLVGAQVALSVTLLVGAGLLVRSFQKLWHVDLGFNPTGVLTFRVSGSWSETADPTRLAQRIDRSIEELRALPGVEAAATANMLPGVPSSYESAFTLVEKPGDVQTPIAAERRSVSPEYFATMQIPLVQGDLCRRQPRGSDREVMVNQTFAKRYLSTWSTPIGLHLAEARSSSPPNRVVGVVGDARERGLARAPGPIVYVCLSAPNPMPYFLLRTSGEPAAVVNSVRLKVKELEPLRAVYDIAPLEERMGDALAENRLRTAILILFAITALLLACVGLYGTLSYMVTVRRREIGLRLALGASRREIIRHFLAQGLRVVGLACLCGAALSLAVDRILSAMLYGVSPSDPLTLATVVGLVLAVAALAALVPATRAALVQPMEVLRDG